LSRRPRRPRCPLPGITIAGEPPDQPDVRELIAALDRQMLALYPPESNHLLDIETLSGPGVGFFVARVVGRAVGCAALVHRDDYGEVKRMYVSPEMRGHGLARQLLGAVEQAAHEAGFDLLRLEVGIAQPDAIGLYRSFGFKKRGPFGDYRDDPLSIFMEMGVGG